MHLHVEYWRPWQICDMLRLAHPAFHCKAFLHQTFEETVGAARSHLLLLQTVPPGMEESSLVRESHALDSLAKLSPPVSPMPCKLLPSLERPEKLSSCMLLSEASNNDAAMPLP